MAQTVVRTRAGPRQGSTPEQIQPNRDGNEKAVLIAKLVRFGLETTHALELADRWRSHSLRSDESLRGWLAEEVPIAPPLRGGHQGPIVTAIVGLDGADETAAAIRLAAQLKFQAGLSVGVVSDATADASETLLCDYAELLGAPFRSGRSADAIRAIMERMRALEMDVVVTAAGSGLAEAGSIRPDLAKWLNFAGVVQCQLAIRIGDSPQRCDALARSCTPFAADRVLLVCDSAELEVQPAPDRRFGALLSWLRRSGLRLSGVSIGSGLPGGFQAVDPAWFAAKLVGGTGE